MKLLFSFFHINGISDTKKNSENKTDNYIWYYHITNIITSVMFLWVSMWTFSPPFILEAYVHSSHLCHTISDASLWMSMWSLSAAFCLLRWPHKWHLKNFGSSASLWVSKWWLRNCLRLVVYEHKLHWKTVRAFFFFPVKSGTFFVWMSDQLKIENFNQNICNKYVGIGFALEKIYFCKLLNTWIIVMEED